MRLRELVIATRRSPLAQWQANHVRELLQRMGHSVRLLSVVTTGDVVLDRPLNKIGGKGLFLKEIQQALESGVADLAVHSLKDVPMDMPEGHALAAVLEREDPRDCLVARDGMRLRDLPAGARLGTSSLRRARMCLQAHPELHVDFIRGNVEGRLAKLDRGDFDGILLAVAGLRRLGMDQRITELISPELILPAAGQGAIGVEILAKRQDLAVLLDSVNHQPTALCVAAEREVGRLMGASCAEPFAAYAVLDRGSMHLSAKWGREAAEAALFSACATGEVNSLAQATQLGSRVGEILQRSTARSAES